jgi:hypothetical protein
MTKDWVGIFNIDTSNLDMFAGICSKERKGKDGKWRTARNTMKRRKIQRLAKLMKQTKSPVHIDENNA